MNATHDKLAAIYANAGAEETQADHGTSLDAQERACRKHGGDNSYMVVRVTRETQPGAALDRLARYLAGLGRPGPCPGSQNRCDSSPLPARRRASHE